MSRVLPWLILVCVGFSAVATVIKLNTDNAQTAQIAESNHQLIHNLIAQSVQICHDDRQRLKQYRIRGRFDLRTAEIQSRIFRDFLPASPTAKATQDLERGIVTYARFARLIHIIPLPNCRLRRRELRLGIQAAREGESFRHGARRAISTTFPRHPKMPTTAITTTRKGVVAHSGSNHSPGHRPGPPPGGHHHGPHQPPGCVPDNPLGVTTLPVCLPPVL